MYILLILFFASLIGIIIMIGQKLILLQNGRIVVEEKNPLEVRHLEKVKHLTIKNIKKYEHIILVEVLRWYVKSVNFSKDKYRGTKEKIRTMMMKRHINGEKKEISKFLKIIGDYKNRIREIKHKIKKEENL